MGFDYAVEGFWVGGYGWRGEEEGAGAGFGGHGSGRGEVEVIGLVYGKGGRHFEYVLGELGIVVVTRKVVYEILDSIYQRIIRR